MHARHSNQLPNRVSQVVSSKEFLLFYQLNGQKNCSYSIVFTPPFNSSSMPCLVLSIIERLCILGNKRLLNKQQVLGSCDFLSLGKMRKCQISMTEIKQYCAHGGPQQIKRNNLCQQVTSHALILLVGINRCLFMEYERNISRIFCSSKVCRSQGPGLNQFGNAQSTDGRVFIILHLYQILAKFRACFDCIA